METQIDSPKNVLPVTKSYSEIDSSSTNYTETDANIFGAPLSITASAFLMLFALLYMYLMFRIMQTLWHVRKIRNTLQDSNIPEINQLMDKDGLTGSIKECCDGTFLWFPLLSAGFSFLLSAILSITSIVGLVRSVRA